MPAEVTASFALGWSQITIGDMNSVRDRIMHVLAITTRASWLNRLKGRYALKPAERAAIEGIFSEYGIDHVWGTTPGMDITLEEGEEA